MTVKYRCLSREHWLHSTAFSLRFFAPLIAASRHLAPALVNVACRTSCTTRCIGFVMPGSGRLLPWELADGVELTPQMALRVQGDVLGTIALARGGALASRKPISSRSHASSRGESSSRSWRTNVARPAAFRCSIPAGSYRPQRSRSSWRSWSRKPARRRSLT